MKPALRRLAAAPLAALVALASFPCGAAEPEGFKLEPGVVLEVSAIGIPEFRYKVPVNADGVASFPLLPPMKVSGLDLAEVRERVRDGLSKKVFRPRSGDGRDAYSNINPDEVVLDVFEYRPVYVNGDVGKPGEVPFRPGMTVRQAVAVSGGYDLLHSRVTNPFMESADVRGEFEGTWSEYVRQQASNLGLSASLDGKPDADIRAQLKAPLPKATLDRVARNETSKLRASEDDFAKELASLRDGVAAADRQAASLREQQKVLQEAVRNSTVDSDRIRGLYDRNVVAINRMSEEQRNLSFASERLQSVTAQIAQAEIGRLELQRKLQAAPEQRRIKQLSDLQEGETKLDILRGKIGALDEKLVYTGAARSQVLGRKGERPDIVIHRRAGDAVEEIAAGEDETLRSGDVVEVSVRNPYAGFLKTGSEALAR